MQRLINKLMMALLVRQRSSSEEGPWAVKVRTGWDEWKVYPESPMMHFKRWEDAVQYAWDDLNTPWGVGLFGWLPAIAQDWKIVPVIRPKPALPLNSTD